MVEVPTRSLAGGEVSEALRSRPDLPVRASGLRTQLNWITNPDGAAAVRAGFEFGEGGLTKSQDARVRSVPFTFNDSDAVMLEFGANYVRFRKSNALVTTGLVSGGNVTTWATTTDYAWGDLVEHSGTYYVCVFDHQSATGLEPNVKTDRWYELTTTPGGAEGAYLELPTPYDLADLDGMDWAQVYDILRIGGDGQHPQHELRRYSDTRWTLLPTRHAPEATAPSNIQFTATGAGSGQYDLSYQVTAIMESTLDESLPGASGTTATATMVGTTVADFDSDLQFLKVGHGLEDGDLVATTTAEPDPAVATPVNATANLDIFLGGRVFQVEVVDADNFKLKDTAGLVELESTLAAYPGCQITYGLAQVTQVNRKKPKGDGTTRISLSWDAVEGAVEYWIYRRDNSAEFGYIGKSKSPAFDDDGDGAGVAIVPRQDFAPPSHNTPFTRGKWPRRMAFHQQREAVASSVDEPFLVTVSKTGDLRDYSRHIPLVENDAFAFKVAGLRADAINGLVSLDGLLILTQGAIWSAQGGADGGLTPSAPGVRLITERGAGPTKPAVVDSAIVYVDRHRRFPFYLLVPYGGVATDGYGARPLHTYARHLFRGYRVTRLAYQAEPNSVVWAVRDDGTLLGMTFEPQDGVIAWHRHEVAGTGAKVYDVAVIPEDGHDHLYALICRTINGTDTYSVERMAYDAAGEPDYTLRDAVHLDGATTTDGTHTAATTSMTLSGGTTWAVGEAGLTLTASVATFPGDGSNVGNGYRLFVTAEGVLYEVEVEVTADASTTVQTVTVLAARTLSPPDDPEVQSDIWADVSEVPAQLRSTAITGWVAMVTTITVGTHLEAEQVYANADGVALGPFTVDGSGQISLGSRPYGVVHAGCLPQFDLEPLDLDFDARGGSPLARPVRFAGVFASLMHTRGLSALAAPGKTPRPFPMPTHPLQLADGLERADLGSAWTTEGRYIIRQLAPHPATVSALIPASEVGGSR